MTKKLTVTLFLLHAAGIHYKFLSLIGNEVFWSLHVDVSPNGRAKNEKTLIVCRLLINCFVRQVIEADRKMVLASYRLALDLLESWMDEVTWKCSYRLRLWWMWCSLGFCISAVSKIFKWSCTTPECWWSLFADRWYMLTSNRKNIVSTTDLES